MTPTAVDPAPDPASGADPATAPEAVPRWVTAGSLAVSLFVLASCALCVAALAGAGVSRTDGAAAHGVVADPLPAPLPSWVAGPLGSAVMTAVLFGPLAVLVGAVVSAVSLHASWRGRERERGDLQERGRGPGRLDPCALATVVVALALLALCAAWGEELWTWALD